MKRFFTNLAIVALAVFALVSCNSEIIGTPDTPEMYTVNLGWKGDLTITHTPMAKASSDDLYGIQVYSTPNVALEEGQLPVWSYYAFGLYDDPDNITIRLMAGYKYKFVATMVRNAKNKIYKDGDTYEVPFFVSGVEQGYGKLTNSFSYSSLTYMANIGNSWTCSGYTDENGNLVYGHFYRPNTDRFYGELTEYIPEEENQSAAITMARVSYAVKFKSSGEYANDGCLEIVMRDAFKIVLNLEDENSEYSDIYTFTNIQAAWENRTNGYTEKVETAINWNRADGTVIPLGTHYIDFKRFTTTSVKVELNESTLGGNLNLGFELTDDGDMPDGDEVVIK